MKGDNHDGIVIHGRSREFRMHMKNPAETGSGCIRFSDWIIENATFAEYSCPIRLRGARYLYLNVAVEKRNISGVYRYNWVSERITNKQKILRRSGEGEKGRCLPWSKEEEGAYIFLKKQVPVVLSYQTRTSQFNWQMYVKCAYIQMTDVR